MLSENGKHRNSKSSKGKRKLRKVKCLCKEMVEYHESDIINLGNGLLYVECPYCGNEIKI